MKIPLFDLGNVMVRFDWSPFLNWLGERSTKSPKAEAFLNSSMFFDFESGSIGREEFTRRMSFLYGADFSQSEFEEKFCGIFRGPVNGMVEIAEELAAKGPIYILSNTNEMHLGWLRRHEPGVFAPFAKVFASNEMGLRKPYPGIYRQVASELNVPPSDILFIDDVHANVAGALTAGLEAHVFSEAGQLKGLLKHFQETDDKT